jgi:osmotically-inducible protein OsmY
MINRQRSQGLNIAVIAILIMGFCGCDKSEGIVSSEDTLASVTAEVIDMELAHSVKVALAEQESLADVDIAVKVSNGEVILRGIVDNQAQHDLAVKIASDVTGVESVEDALGIKEQN